MNEYFVQELEKSGYYAEHPERYAFMRSDAFSAIVGHTMNESTPKEIGGYLAITNIQNKKTIYRKYHGCNLVEDNHVMLDYRTICELGLPKEIDARLLRISQSTWWKFYFFNSDDGIRNPAWLAVLGLIFTFLSLLMTVIFYIFPNCCM